MPIGSLQFQLSELVTGRGFLLVPRRTHDMSPFSTKLFPKTVRSRGKSSVLFVALLLMTSWSLWDLKSQQPRCLPRWKALVKPSETRLRKSFQSRRWAETKEAALFVWNAARTFPLATVAEKPLRRCWQFAMTQHPGSKCVSFRRRVFAVGMNSVFGYPPPPHVHAKSPRGERYFHGGPLPDLWDDHADVITRQFAANAFFFFPAKPIHF